MLEASQAMPWFQTDHPWHLCELKMTIEKNNGIHVHVQLGYSTRLKQTHLGASYSY